MIADVTIATSSVSVTMSLLLDYVDITADVSLFISWFSTKYEHASGQWGL